MWGLIIAGDPGRTDMTIMTWTPSLDVGVSKMNDEHQGLLKLMNDLHDAHQAGKRGFEVLKILDALGAATVKHFADEEVYMESVNYPKLKTHKLIHQDLLKKFGTFSEAIHAKNGEIGDDFFTFLKLWLFKQVMNHAMVLQT